MLTDSSEVIGRPGSVLYTCEHASNRVPGPIRLRPADRRLLALHWGYDIGAANLTRALARRGPGLAVLARWSRLLLDANRAPADASAVLRDTHDGKPTFNTVVDLHGRLARFHVPFHATIDATLTRQRPRWIWSIHTYTPTFAGVPRPMEAGVLFDAHDEVCAELAAAMNRRGLRTELNEPYSGKAGLIYSANRHGTRHGLPYLEIEVRQDLVASRRAAERVAALVLAAQRDVGF